jgi:uncharacterized membrane protein
MSKARFEAFSDGIFAVIITIMVLDNYDQISTSTCGRPMSRWYTTSTRSLADT